MYKCGHSKMVRDQTSQVAFNMLEVIKCSLHKILTNINDKFYCFAFYNGNCMSVDFYLLQHILELDCTYLPNI